MVLIERLGHSADRAGDGIDAIEALQTGHKCDVVLLDVTMPHMTGEEVLCWLQQHAESATGVRGRDRYASADDDPRGLLEALWSARAPLEAGVPRAAARLHRRERAGAGSPT